MFIGDTEVLNTTEKDGFVTVELKGIDPIVIRTELFDAIKSEEVGTANYRELINLHFAKKFLAELAFNKLPYHFSVSTGMYMENLAHNLREELFRKDYECGGADDISLLTIFPE
jgi:hypothetical protein